MGRSVANGGGSTSNERLEPPLRLAGSQGAGGPRRFPNRPSIGDCAVIGDGRTAAIVQSDGAISWLCLPDFSSPSVFGSLLDEQQGGRCCVQPTVPAQVERHYRDGTPVLDTWYRTRSGVLCITDFMPVPEPDGLYPQREILRRLTVVEGEVPLRIQIAPRPDYGRCRPRLQRRGASWLWTWGRNWLLLSSDLPLHEHEGDLQQDIVLRGGEHRWLSLAYEQGNIGILPSLHEAPRRLAQTERWWRQWSARARYAGPYRKAVVRSAITLKLLTSALTGAVVAAATTSLPENLGGSRNYDARFCCLRDAALTMRTLLDLGYWTEARAFLDWLLHATGTTWPRLRVLYDLFGRAEQHETQLPHWRGFCDSRPVRIGNAAHRQLKLHVYGSVCMAARDYVQATGELSRAEARVLRGFGEAVCKGWREPDHGIWDLRGRRRQHTSSKIMCWGALNALLQLEEQGHLRVPGRMSVQRGLLEEVIEGRGWNRRLQTYVGTLDGREADGSLLLMGCLGYLPPAHERMRATYRFLQDRLSRGELMLRYEPGFDGWDEPEGAFPLCSFWAVDHLVQRGDLQSAQASFERILSYSNDLELFAEEIDLVTGEPLGNFPQAYTHVGLLTAAMALARAEHRA